MHQIFLHTALLSKESRRQLIHNWMKQYSNEDIFIEALAILEKGEKKYWPSALDIIDIVGYPRNSQAIPTIIALMSDFNSVTVEETIQVLADMDHSAVLPYLLEVIIDMSEPVILWGALVEGICLCLRTKDGSVFAEACIPALAGLLFSEEACSTVDISFILNVFEYIGPTCAPLVLPGLAHTLLGAKDSDIIKQVHRLLSTFDASLINPYLLLIYRTKSSEKSKENKYAE